MKCFIDNHEVELDRETGIAISLSVANVTEIKSGRTGYSKSIRIPVTARNREILGDAGEIHAPELFNQREHTARIEADGCTVMEGVPMITRREQGPGGTGWYHMNIIGAGKAWIGLAAERLLHELAVPWTATLSAQTVANSWTWPHPVRFFPVQRDKFTLPSETIRAGVRMLTFEDYFPFLHVRSLMDRIAAQAGYTLRSRFMDGTFFRSLYMSGRYRERDPEIPNERMGFLAGRFNASTVVADHYGRVYADPLTPLHSLGNLVDTADPEESRNGVMLSGVYNTNNAFRTFGNRVGFFPVEEVVAGFEYALKYRTDYKLASRTELTCFNRLYLDDGIERRYKVMNRNVDRRSEFHDNRGYLLVVFGHVDGSAYRFTYDRVTNSAADLNNLQPADYTRVTLKTFSTRSTTITVPGAGTIVNPLVWIRVSDTVYITYGQDWALYDGYVTETGQVDLSVTVRSSARRFLPSQPCYFDQIYFGGAEQGMSMTLSNETTLRPVFTSHPGEGAAVTFADVAAHPVRQIELVNALKQMFNLYFYTDTLTKTIYVEPREEFYGDKVVDWSERIDLSRPITVEELGADLARTLTLRYQGGDGAVARWNSANNQVMGRWSAQILNRFAKEVENSYSNPLFTASLNKRGVYPDAEAASVVQAGDRDATGQSVYGENLNFPAKIVSYAGMKNLPADQWWGWPAYGQQYPLIAFHDAEVSTLCFEDRDGQTGLHRYYDKTVELYNTGRRITLWLNLAPEDVEPFIIPNDLEEDFRALFKLRIDGETVMCRLESIEDYNPARTGPTRCVFLKNV